MAQSLGTPNAQPVEVGDSVGINQVDQGINDLPDYAEQEAYQEFKNPESGGLGGLLGLEIEITDDEEQDVQEPTTTTAKPKKKRKKKKKPADAAAAGVTPAPGAAAGVTPAPGAAAGVTPAPGAAAGVTPAPGGAGAGADIGVTEADDGMDNSTAVEEEIIIDDGLEPITRRKRSANDYKGLEYNMLDEQKARSLQISLLNNVAQKLDDMLSQELHLPDLASHPGWTTLDAAGTPEDVFSHESVAFVGFGACAYKKVTKEDYDDAKKDVAAIIKVISTALRTHCVKQEAEFYDELIKDDFIELGKDKTLQIAEDNKYVSADKLTPKQRSSLSRALELAVFSKVFKAELNNESPLKAPKKTKISRRVKVFGDAMLEGITLIKSKLKHHEVKLLRSLALTTKTAFMKLLQDYEATKDCEECSEDLEVIEADMKHLLGIIEFIVHGSAPLDKDPSKTEELFKTFSETNEDVIAQRVDAYLA